MSNTNDNKTDGTDRDWWAENNEVIRRERDGKLFHVLGRFENVDTGRRRYELHDDTHTTREYWAAEDVRDCFEQTSAVVLHSRKPRQVLDGRLYEDERSLHTET